VDANVSEESATDSPLSSLMPSELVVELNAVAPRATCKPYPCRNEVWWHSSDCISCRRKWRMTSTLGVTMKLVDRLESIRILQHQLLWSNLVRSWRTVLYTLTWVTRRRSGTYHLYGARGPQFTTTTLFGPVCTIPPDDTVHVDVQRCKGCQCGVHARTQTKPNLLGGLTVSKTGLQLVRPWQEGVQSLRCRYPSNDDSNGELRRCAL
jgi:hypothetical protein